MMIEAKDVADAIDETRVREIIVPEHQTRERLDQFLVHQIERVTRSQINRLIKDGRVTINNVLAKPSHPICPGERIRIIFPPPKIYDLQPENIPLDILYEDESLLVIHKKAGMVVHPAYGNASGTLVNALMHHCRSLSQLSGPNRPGLVHRLDKDTSGLLVVAKNDYVHSQLAQQFSRRTIQREYRALVWGHLLEKTGRIETFISRSSKDRTRMIIASQGKEAITNYMVLKEYPLLSFLRIKLETGRTHQIRVHLSAKGHPVLGDQTYGGRHKQVMQLNKSQQALGLKLLQMMPRQALHAKTLGFIHPETGQELLFDSELPEDMQQVIDFLETQLRQQSQ
ncbi:MAG: RluA family pseudouridine synthase [candidate division KSB1 bacterium]|nr:RluA family pseudouridine synthase [candidate division KSB1 bacterium]MDZ7340260.1 RluA family pseudouridine synthase [candidate division KSB1 bacterium]